MRRGRLFLSTALFLAILVGCSGARMAGIVSASPAQKVDDRPVVVIDTSAGAITVELDREKAPISVENFLKYVDKGFYDGLVFHRVIENFMIQGGGMKLVDGVLVDKKEGAFPPIKNESQTSGLRNLRGTIAMARTENANSATSQFYINHANNARLDAPPGYAVFGRVTEGMDVVDAIAKGESTMEPDRFGTLRKTDVPAKPVLIKSVKRKS